MKMTAVPECVSSRLTIVTPFALKTFHAHDRSALVAVGFRRWPAGRHGRGRRRFVDDADPDPAVRRSSSGRGRHRPALCGGHQNRRQPSAWTGAQHRLARDAAVGERQRSGDGRHAGRAVPFQPQRRGSPRPDYAGAQRRAVCHRVRAGVWRSDRGDLSRTRQRT